MVLRFTRRAGALSACAMLPMMLGCAGENLSGEGAMLTSSVPQFAASQPRASFPTESDHPAM